MKIAVFYFGHFCPVDKVKIFSTKLDKTISQNLLFTGHLYSELVILLQTSVDHENHYQSTKLTPVNYLNIRSKVLVTIMWALMVLKYANYTQW